MNERRGPLFLERESYRQRRTIDAARLLPMVGFLALCLPILWGNGEVANGVVDSVTNGGADDVRMTSVGVIYLFGVWSVLITTALLLSRRLRRIDADQGPPD